MSTIAQRFTKFLKNLQLTEKQIQDAITKHTGVRKTLHNHYYPSKISNAMGKSYSAENHWTQVIHSYLRGEIMFDDSPTYSTSYLVGSYGKNTAIRPPSDIDILFILPSNLFNQYDNRSGNGQSQLLQDVKNVLLSTYPRTEIRADGQVVKVNFESYAVEVIPAFQNHYSAGYTIPDTNQGGSWQYTNPKAEKSVLSESNKKTKGNIIRLIKMVKAWKQFCNVPLKSFAIELTVIDFLITYEYNNQSAIYYDWMVRDYLDYLVKHRSFTYPIPGITEKLYVGDKWLSKAKTAYNNAVSACDCERDNYCYSATTKWKKIFGDDFEY